MSARWDHDKEKLSGGAGVLVGVDEAGRGALAGPVVAAAVALESSFFNSEAHQALTEEVDDSKQLSPEQREGLFELLQDLANRQQLALAWGSASVDEIESLNILGATRLAMRRALEFLQDRAGGGWRLPPEDAADPALFPAGLPGNVAAPNLAEVLVDGRPLRPFPYRHEGLVQGDSRSLCIAMASIVAKVRRDRILVEMSRHFPDFHFEENKGYGTPAHREALLNSGPCRHHRPTFLRKIQSEREDLQPDLGF